MTSRAAKALAALAIAAGLGLAACGGPSTSAAAPPAATTKGSVPGMPGMSMPDSAAGTPQSGQASGAAAAPAKPVSGTAIDIQNFAFSPTSLSIKAGTKVTWTNKDTDAHTATAKDGTFHSEPLNTGQSYSFTFTKPGTYSYYCTIHPFMVATVVVS
jgi:plastocyanin